jgi:hypothetical protein
MAAITNSILAVILVLILVVAFVNVWWDLKKRKSKVWCPNCNKFTAEKSDEELMGIFRKGHQYLIPRRKMIPDSDIKMVWYEKYKIHNRCNGCGYEWTCTESRRQ